jgi:hypothetical protein
MAGPSPSKSQRHGAQRRAHTWPRGNREPSGPACPTWRAAPVYGERAGRVSGFGERVWEDMAPLLRFGWEGRHAEICPIAPRDDWRSNWPAVRDGWCGAGG